MVESENKYVKKCLAKSRNSQNSSSLRLQFTYITYFRRTSCIFARDASFLSEMAVHIEIGKKSRNFNQKKKKNAQNVGRKNKPTQAEILIGDLLM